MRVSPGVASGDAEERAPSLRLFHGCIAAIALGVFIIVILPLLVWSAGILLAGAR